MIRRQLLCIVFVVGQTLIVPLVPAAIIVDPLSTGATDVRVGNSSLALLTNPVADPFSTTRVQIGYDANGTLWMTGGSKVNSHSTYVGVGQGAVGNLLLDGSGTLWSSSYVFSVGTGTVNITNGAKLVSNQGGIGAGSSPVMGDCTVNISGTGSQWDVESKFFSLGNDYGGNKGLLHVGAGAVVNINTEQGTFNIDEFPSEIVAAGGSLRVVGAGSRLNKSGALGIRLGDLWQYGLEVANGGQVDVDGDLLIRELEGATSRVRFDNGTINAHTFWFNPARLTGTGTVNATGLVVDGDLTFNASLGPQQQLVLQDLPGQNVTINLDHTQIGSLGVGHFGVGHLVISEGRQLTTRGSGFLGKNIGSTGTAKITGVDTKWTVTDDLVVGDWGQGILRIEEGSSVSATFGVFVGRSEAAAGSKIEFTGGTLNAGTLFTTGKDLVGTGVINTTGLVADCDIIFSQSSGTQQQIVFDELPGQNVTVNLHLGGGTLGAGYRGRGSLTVSGGQMIYAKMVALGYGSGGQGEGLISGLGSELIAPTFRIGDIDKQAHGRLQIVAGGKAGAGTMRVQRFGEVTVEDTGSLLDAHQLQVATGSVDIRAGATAQGSADIRGGSQLRVRGAGSKYLTDSMFIQQSLLTIEDEALVEFQVGGRLSVEGGTVSINGGTLDLGGGNIFASTSGSQFILAHGTLKNVRTLTGNLQQFGGEFVVSPRPVKTVIAGDYSMSGDSVLRIVVDQPLTNGAELMRVQENLMLGGTLEVEWGESMAGFTPALGSFYPLFGDPQNIVGHFDEVILPELNPNLRWHVVDDILHGRRRMLLTVLAAGDFDQDGDVDGRDFLTWQRNPSVGDLADWQGGYDDGTLASVDAVPEPNSLVLLLAGCLLLRAVGRND